VDLAARIRADLRAVADPSRAAGQQAYMKSAMPFLGVRVPDVRRIARSAAAGEADGIALQTVARTLWDDATHREERYAAEALLTLRPVRGDLAAVPLIERMVRTGQWWDITDELSGRMADLHDAHPAATAEIVRAWSVDEDIWIRRIAILSQLGRRDGVDPTLLADVIGPSLARPEFFLRKAIGWALRDYARVEPTWVARYAASHELSPLSRREAMKHLA
jgi:3-methyladenine DNA glycosylase AlkD